MYTKHGDNHHDLLFGQLIPVNLLGRGGLRFLGFLFNETRDGTGLRDEPS
jgi:hypothetical protein